MKRIALFGFVAGISALAVSSCAYDPYYSGGYGGGHGGGYGDGYGYGGSGFSTSYFVGTGSSRWGYDPYAGAYYDYSRRCYYDPYLSGYYPVGYRPRYVTGSPHPHGWSSGSDYCAPPVNVRSYNLTNYHDRSERYRSLGRSWSSDVTVNSHDGDHHSGYGDRGQRGSENYPTQRQPYGDRSENSGSIFGGGSQRPSYDGSGSSPTGVFSGRSGSDRRDDSPQRSGFTRPDFRSRESSGGDAGRIHGNPERGASSPMVNPGISMDQRQRGSNNSFGGRSEAPQRSVEPSPQPSPQIESGGENSGGRRERNDSGRGEGREIRGLGEG